MNQTLSKVRRLILERSFRRFAEAAWHVVEPGDYVSGFWSDAICDHLQAVAEGKIRNLVINIQPRIGKSTFTCVLWPAWVWATRPQRRFLFGSYSYDISVRDSVRCRRLIESDWYQSQWGDRVRIATDQNTKEKYENTAGGHRIATSVGGSTTGQGGDIVVVDDPHEILKVESDAHRQNALDWWDRVMSMRVNSPRTGARVIIMQRLHENDLTGHVIEQGGYDLLRIPSIYDPEDTSEPTSLGWKDPRSERGQLICPERFNEDFYSDAKKRLGSYGYAGQIQQRPLPKEGGVIKRQWVQYYDYLPPLDEFDLFIQSWDTAFKQTDESSFVVGQVWGRRYGAFYLFDQIRDRMDFTGTVHAIVALSAKWPMTTAKLVEEKANGAAVISVLKQRVPGLVPVEPEGGKEARCQAVAPFWESGSVFIPSPEIASFPVGDFVEEICSFPKSANNDQVDAMSQALVYMSKTANYSGGVYFTAASRRAAGSYYR